MKKKCTSAKSSLLLSSLSMLLCIVMLTGTTLAWFTDIATSSGNIIQTGSLDIGMYWSENNADWHNAEGNSATPIFDYDKWEPGYTEVRYVKVTNDGSLAFMYKMLLSPNGEVSKLGEVIDVIYDIVSGNDKFIAPSANDKQGSLTKVGTLDELLSANGPVAGGVLLPEGQTAEGYYSGEIIVCIALHMQETAGNEYQGLSIGSTFNINLYATQFSFEEDSFDPSYDDEAEWPEIPSVGNSASTPINVNNEGILAEDTIMTNDDGSIEATLPAGVKFNTGVNATNLSVQRMSTSEANITVGEREESRSYDIHVEGISPDNTVPVEILIKEFLPVGLNLGNYSLYHVENGITVTMTLADDTAAHVHNTFTYDPLTGDVTLYMATFSEVALVADTEKTWTGNVDHSWYLNAVAPIYEDIPVTYYIANADQLWSFSQIVGGMAKYNNGEEEVTIPADTFEGKTVKLMADINIGDTNEYYDDASENGLVFYPIGYYNSEGTYKKTGTAITSGFRLFMGTFDGNGFTVANFYQNTWEMKGDHNWYAPEDQNYRDGMGLFGRVYGGTIKNLTVKNFSSDGEITTTGSIAAYADHGALFENIAVINCNPRVYNIGNGGIVGVVGWYEKEVTDAKVTFRNITVDNSNKISALWGSWDVACGGIVGTYYPTSGQSSANYPKNPGISFENCHVGAQIDVNNDVCANYQYYAYRYSGMLIGSVDENVTIDGRVYPKMDGIVTSDCTVHFGTWNDYYYCELVDNSTASYTHDYQMSRLTEIKAIDGTTITYLDGTTGTVPASGRANYVIVDYSKGHGDENATCHHFKDGEVWTHDMGGTEVIDGVEVLKEDKQHLYLEFNNLVTGNGWGVTSKAVGDFDGVAILDRTQADSIEKFEGRETNGKLAYPISGREYKISHLFNLLETDVRVIPGALTVTVTNLDQDGNVTAEFTRSASNWADSTIVFSGNGKVRVTIQDYFYCDPTSIDLTIRSYPEGSIILNFTYDGFKNNEDYVIPDTADQITTGKHGTYDFDFGFGPEVLDHALKIDSKGSIEFKATSNGTIAIALASNTVGASLKYTKKATDGTEKTEELVRIYEANKLVIVHIDVKAGESYKFFKGENETAIYYIGYLPDSAVNAPHDCAYYEKTTATCTKGGTTTRTCLVCGKGSDFEVGALGHSYITTEAYDSTCTTVGKTEGIHCVNCGEKTLVATEIAKIPHVYENGICVGCGGLEKEFSHRITHSIDFTTGKSNDYAEYRTYFLPRGICTVDGSGKYVIMKSIENNRAYVEFTTDHSTTLIVTASSTGRNNTSEFILTDADGNIINAINNRTVATGVNGTTFIYTIETPGTYRFVCTSTERVGRLMSMKTADKHSYELTSTTAATCSTAGQNTYVCSGCRYEMIEVIPATGQHSFVNDSCTVCEISREDANKKIHNFTADGKDSAFFTINGSLSKEKGTVTYNNLTLTQCLKIESSTNISFEAPSAGTLTLVFVEATPNIKIDGTKVSGSNGIITIDLEAGTHTIAKADTMNLFYMVYTPSN